MKNAILISIFLLVACSQTTQNKPAEAIPSAENQVMCTQDAKQCADGTWVGRTPPSCAFICPSGNDASK